MIWAFGALVLLSVSALGEPLFVRRTAQMPEDTTVTGWRKHMIELKTGHFMFAADTGKKIHAIFRSQGLTVDCAKIEGNWVGPAQNATLETATMTGGVRAVFTRHSQNPGSSAVQTTTVTGDTVTFTNAGFALHVIGSVHMDSDDPGAQQSLSMAGTSADIELSKPHTSGRAVRAATVAGPVRFEMRGFRTDSSGNAPARLPFTLNGLADRALFDDAARTVTLVGNVHLTADDPNLGGDQNVDKETIYLAPDGSVDRVEGEGNPGTTTFIQKVKSGGGKRK